MGTRFMCTVERYGSNTNFVPCSLALSSPIHQNIKEKIVASTEYDTTHIFRTLNNTSRVFKNVVSQQVVAIERRPGGAKFEDVRDLVSGARGRIVFENGDPDYGIWTAGLVLGLIKDIPTCEELLSRIEREAEEIISGMSKLVKPKAKL
jgi:NAD(P)H-dependent flavin oxidoreductase YrpB (nitropropane dioxygenase family)